VTKTGKNVLVWYAFIVPAFTLYGIFLAFPLVWSFYLSFCRSDGVNTVWRGVSRYVQVATDPVFLNALYNTFYIAFFTLAIGLSLALVIACLLNELRFFRTPMRIVYFLPYITSLIAAAVLWTYIFEPKGLLNWFLGFLGLPTPVWIHSVSTAKMAVVIFAIWHSLGYQIIIYLAGLQTVPLQLYEAAKIDGAGRWHCFTKITVPMLTPVTVFLIITGLIAGMQRFTDVFIFGSTVGNPARSIQTVVCYIYEQGWGMSRMGFASTVAWLFFAFLMAITVINLKILLPRRQGL